jgi:hypothetical protein
VLAEAARQIEGAAFETVDLASPAAGYVIRQTLVVNGGVLAGF